MDDQHIIQLLQERNSEALQHLEVKYRSYCLQIANNILANAEDAEECVNDVLHSVWRSIPPHEPENLSAYLGKLTRNAALNKHRDNTALKRSSNILYVMEEVTQMVSGKETPEQLLHAKELSSAISNFMGTLPPLKRFIMIRRYWYYDSVKEIAKQCLKSESHVSMILTRLRRQLATYLKEMGFDL